MNRCFFLCALAVLTAASQSAFATEEAHFDVFLGVSGGETAFGGIDVDDGEITPDVRVFEAEVAELELGFSTIFTADEPGFNHPGPASPGFGNLPSGVTAPVEGDKVFVNQLPLTVDGVTSTVFFWDGVGSPSFAPPTDAVFDIVTGTGGSIGSVGAGGAFDDHPLFELSTPSGSLPTPGIYLGSFEASIENLEATVPLFLVMGTEGLITAEFLGIDQADFNMLTDDDLDEALEEVIDTAIGFVETEVIPEPASAALFGIAVAMFAGRRRR